MRIERVKQIFWIFAGTVFAILGFLGIILPILPTIPFLLLASACYFRGSKKIYDLFIRLFLKNKFYEKYVKKYITKHNERYIKLTFIFLVTASSFFSFTFFAKTNVAKLGVAGVALGLIIYIYTVKLVRSS